MKGGCQEEFIVWDWLTMSRGDVPIDPETTGWETIVMVSYGGLMAACSGQQKSMGDRRRRRHPDKKMVEKTTVDASDLMRMISSSRTVPTCYQLYVWPHRLIQLSSTALLLKSGIMMMSPGVTAAMVDGHQSGDMNLDANVLLAELDKGLRSPRAGDQCESIVRFPWLFERYPFPILINSASLKLAELFRVGSNFSRLLILRVVEQSQKHLDKISNADEFVKRITSVSYCNDPVARALTLRMLGSIASITADRKDIHHCIRDSLDSRDEVEANAAIEAAAAFARESLDFALNISPKVLSMIRGLATPLEAKTRLLSVLHHPHYDSKVALEVRNECLRLLPTYPSEKFICSALHTLTYVSSASLMLIPQQISLLLKYFTSDTRLRVKRRVASELGSLAESSPHLWMESNVTLLVKCVLDAENESRTGRNEENLLMALIRVLSLICKSPSLISGESESRDHVSEMCLRIVYGSHSVPLTATCFDILTLMSASEGEANAKITQETLCAFQAFILCTPTQTSPTISKKDQEGYRGILKSIVTFSRSQEDVSKEMVSSLHMTLMMGRIALSDFWISNICETISAIESASDCDELHLVLLQILESRRETLSDEALVRILTLDFQTLVMMDEKSPLNLAVVMEGRNLWTCFKVLRAAMRYGQAACATGLSSRLMSGSSSETSHFYLQSLHKMCSAEMTLMDETEDLDIRLSRSVALYVECLSSLRAAVTPANPLRFQCEYLTLRLKLLQVHEMLRQSCQLIRTAPAPAVAASVAISSRDDLVKHGTIVNQMRKSAREFRSLSECYSGLFQASFNADDQTLSHMQLLQSSCTIVAEAIESLFQANRVSSLFVDDHTHLENSRLDNSASGLPSTQHRRLIRVCRSISASVAQHLSSRRSTQIDCSQIRLLQSIGADLLAVPLCIPRLFFQSVQSVSVKLAISPQPKNMGELILVPAQTQFALRVEGVIVSGRHRTKMARRVSKIMLHVTSSALSKNAPEASAFTFGKVPPDYSINTNCVVVPKNDYFQSQFLLNLNPSGIHNIMVEAAIIDEHEAQWKTGPVATTSVKVLEEVAQNQR